VICSGTDRTAQAYVSATSELRAYPVRRADVVDQSFSLADLIGNQIDLEYE
jgi:hypothetical protein